MSKPKSMKKAAKASKTSKTVASKKSRSAAIEEPDRTPEELAALPKLVTDASGHSSIEGTEAQAEVKTSVFGGAGMGRLNEKKGPKAPKEKAPKEDLMVFAFRLTKVESEQLHKAAGPGKASSFARNLLVKAAQAVRQGATVESVLDAIAGC